MGSENSKSDDQQKSQKKQPERNVRQRLYTEHEIQTALANQKRMFEAKQLQTSVTPSAPPENVLFSSRNTYQQTSQHQPHLQFQRTVTPTSAGPSNEISSQQQNPAQQTTRWSATSPGLSQASSFSARTSHASPSSSGPSHASLSSTGPYKQNHKQFQAPRPKPRSRCNQNKRNCNGIVNCVTCNGQLSLHIYQCSNGHSSCEGCRLKGARCGNCNQLITDMRNITLESTLAELTINTEGPFKCPNAKDGCRLQFNREDLENHLVECTYNIIACPMMEFSGDCNWKGMIKELVVHFNDAHPQHREAYVNQEMDIVLIDVDYKVLHLVNIGFHKFLVHMQLDKSLNNIYMVTQFLGTNFGASKWTYEWHVYNKKERRRKFEYKDICKSNVTPISKIFESNDCAVMNMDYAKTFLDNGKLTFKFYIKKNNDTTSN